MGSKKTYLAPSIIRIINTLVLVVYFLLSSAGFWYFEPNLVMRIGYLVILGAAVFEFISLKRALGFILFTLYLTLFSFLNILYSGNFSLWFIFLLLSPIVISLVALWKKSNRFSWIKKDSLLTVLILLAILEGLMTLSFLNLAPYIQSFFILMIPLFALEIASDVRAGTLSQSRIIRITLLVLLAIITISLTMPREVT